MRLARALMLGSIVVLTFACDPVAGIEDDGKDDGASDGGGESDDDAADDEGDEFRGCGRYPDAILDEWIDVDGAIREYILELPPDYDADRAYPIVFAFHGLTESQDTAARRFRIVQEWEGEAIGIYPHKPDGALWDFAEDGPDVAFFDALYARVSAELCIDPALVFVAGFSAGGYFSNTLMCARPEIVRAAAVGGAGPPEVPCETVMPIWAAHATYDEIVPFDTGLAMRDFWWAQNQCSASWVPLPEEPRCVEYEGCIAPTVWCEYETGHWWMEEWENPAMTVFLRRFVGGEAGSE